MRQRYGLMAGHAHASGGPGGQGQPEDGGWMPTPALSTSCPRPGMAAPPPVHGKKPPGPTEGPICETQEYVLSKRSCHSLSLLFMACHCDPRHSSGESGSDFSSESRRTYP